ncbi:MAG TPA: PKD domain-containing protein [Candidatus Thermoplasmatota archaeon]|nr:PKD domain-containing protein [Candidatus Thermoplasmatota archaeon]
MPDFSPRSPATGSLTTMNKTNAILLTFAMLAAGLALTPTTLAVHGTGLPDVRFRQYADFNSDPTNPTGCNFAPGCVYGIGTSLVIEVQDNGQTGDTVSVTVTSAPLDTSTGEVITLRRLTPNNQPTTTANSFFGTVGFESGSASAGNGKVAVAEGSTVSVRYDDLGGGTHTDTIRFKVTASGVVTTDSPTYYGACILTRSGGDCTTVAASPEGGSASSFIPTVTDADRNIDSTVAETVTLRVHTTADLNDEVTVILTETGTNTGVFTVNANMPGVQFALDNSNDDVSADPRDNEIIQVVDGATITLLYDDPQDEKGNPRVIQNAQEIKWRSARLGAIELTDANFAPMLVPYAGVDKIYIRVVDKDKSGSALSVTVSTASPANGLVKALTEIAGDDGALSGVFQGSVDLDTNGVITAGRLAVIDPSPATATGATITVSYNDNRALDGSDPVPLVTDSVDWNANTAGTLQLVRCDGITDASDFYGISGFALPYANGFATCAPAGNTATTLGQLGIRVVDADMDRTVGANNDNGIVNVVLSSSMETAGLMTLTLTESTTTAGVFTGMFPFNFALQGAAAPTPTVAMWVRDGATLTATYTDIDATGNSVVRTDTATWHIAETAAAPTLTGDFLGAVIRGVSTATGGPFVTIEVKDHDANANHGSADTVNVLVFSTTDSSGFTSGVTLTETGINSGIFRGRFGFTTGITQNPGANPGLLRVTAGDTITVRYTDAVTGTGVLGNVVNNAANTWNVVTAASLISVNGANPGTTATYYGTTDLVTVTVRDTDGNTNAAERNCFKVGVDSASDAGATPAEPPGSDIQVMLFETDVNTGIFAGTFGFVQGTKVAESGDAACGATVTLPGTMGRVSVPAVGGTTVTITPPVTTPPITGSLVITWAPYADATAVDFWNNDDAVDGGGAGTQFETDAPIGAQPVLPGHFDFGINDPLWIQVTDADRNLHANLLDAITVTVAGETISLIETGVNSGIFNRPLAYPVFYEATATAGNGRINVSPGASVGLTYADVRPTSGTSASFTDSMVWFSSGTLNFQQTLGGATSTAYEGFRTIFLEVNGAQLRNKSTLGSTAGADTLTVTLTTRDATGESETVTLTETGADTGIFRGSIALSDFPIAAANGVLDVGSSATDRDDLIMMRYQDIASAVGGADTRPVTQERVFKTVPWARQETGTVQLFAPNPLNVPDPLNSADPWMMTAPDADPDAGGPLPGDLDGDGVTNEFLGETTGHVQVFDLGANADPLQADSVDVKIVSNSNPTGITISATETGGSTGIFRGSFGFRTDVVDGTLQVVDGDTVSAAYTDPKRTDGTSGTATSTGLFWNQKHDATLTVSKRKFSDVESATLTVADKDADRTSGIDTLGVVACAFDADGATAAASSSCSNVVRTATGDIIVNGNVAGGVTGGAGAVTDGTNLVLSETGPTTGTFVVNQVDFGAIAGDVIHGEPDGAYIVFIYDDQASAQKAIIAENGVVPDLLTTTVRWYPSGASINPTTPDYSGWVSFDKSSYFSLTAPVTLTVQDRDLDTQANVRDTALLRVVSTSDPRGEVISLLETDVTTGIFTFASSSFFETAFTLGNNRVRVEEGDRVTAFYFDTADGDSVLNTNIAADTAVDRDSVIWTSSNPAFPTAHISANPTSGNAPLEVLFTVSVDDDLDQVNTWSVDFDDGETHPGGGNLGLGSQTVQHEYAEGGTYTATLSLTDSQGNTDTDTAIITVSGEADTVAPGDLANLELGTGGTTTRIVVQWTAPADDGLDDTSGPVAGYVAKLVEDADTCTGETFTGLTSDLGGADFDYGTIADPGDLQEATFDDLTPDTQYCILIKALDEAPNASDAASLFASTEPGDDDDPEDPGAVTTLTAEQGEDAGELELSWTAPGDDGDVGTVSGYFLKVETVTFSPATFDDDDLPAGVSYTLDAPIVGPGETQTAVLRGLDIGETYFIAVRAVDDAVPPRLGPAAGPITVTVADVVLTEEDLIAVNEDITGSLEVEVDGNNVTLTWDLPDTDLPIAGIQIWESVNPITLIADLQPGDEAFEEQTFTVVDATPGASYFITVYYGTDEALGFVDASVGEEFDAGDLPAFVTDIESQGVAGIPKSGGDDKWAWWIWALIIGGGLLIIGLIVFLVLLMRRRGGDEAAWDAGAEEGWSAEEGGEAAAAEGSDAWPAADTPPDAAPDSAPIDVPAAAAVAPPPPPAGPDIHQVTCPKCATEFTAHGQKPLVIECPNCHVRGMLR